MALSASFWAGLNSKPRLPGAIPTKNYLPPDDPIPFSAKATPAGLNLSMLPPLQLNTPAPPGAMNKWLIGGLIFLFALVLLGGIKIR